MCEPHFCAKGGSALEDDQLDETLEMFALGIVFILIVIFFVIKEVASYRLAASHPLNRWLNPPHDRQSGSGDAGISIDTGCDGGD
jgi:hypothetical protein